VGLEEAVDEASWDKPGERLSVEAIISTKEDSPVEGEGDGEWGSCNKGREV